MKILLVTILFISSTVNAWAQSQFVIGSSGSTFSSVRGTLEWTIGEISTETYQKSSGFFTQGFHQTFINDLKNSKDIVVYPIPTEEFLFINTLEDGAYQIEIFNLHGIRLINNQVSSTPNNHIHQVDVQPFRAALYHLRIRNISTGKYSAFKIIIL